jgi:diguanylate cyclase (GGDEF)-like protein
MIGEKYMSEQELQALLARVAVLESKNAELENKFGELETQMDTVNKFISAITESQSLENTMNEIESVTKQLTNCDKAAFYCYDNTNGKFFSQGDYRSWQDEQSAEELKNAFDSKDILSDGKEAVIPLVSSSGNSVGVIVAEKSDGFTKEDYDNFKPGCQIVNTVELAMKKEFEHQGRITDELTHLKNRQGLNEYLSDTMCGNLNEGKPVNIIMCDIDHFKQVNDTYGHDAGDIILKGVADVLQEGTRAGADCAFRMGGEEMVCIINAEPEIAMDIAERLRETIENTAHSIVNEGDPIDVKVTVSMGNTILRSK